MNKTLTNLLNYCVLLTLVLTGCVKKPVLTNLDPASGPPGTVVEVVGSSLTLTSVKWDAGLGSETTLPSSFLSAKFFSVPIGATAGNHPVRLSNKEGISDNIVQFNVTAGPIRPKPRIDDVTVNLFSISGGKVTTIIMVHGANFDVGSKLLINGDEVDTYFSKVLRNTDMQATDPSTLGYPIYHYATVWAILQNQTPGAILQVKLKNLDNLQSDQVSYTLASNMDDLDSDGDGLPDKWEEKGYDANGDGTVDIDLPALGANKYRKDIFVEVDWIDGADPNNAIWASIESAFTNAPILNSDGSTGITIHIDRGQAGAGGGGNEIPFVEYIYFPHFGINAALDPATDDIESVYDLKATHFNANRLNIYRYCIFGWNEATGMGYSGWSEGFTCNDFIVTFANWGAAWYNASRQTGTFIHELGHSLNLHHGGAENLNYKPNYNSLMGYTGMFNTPSQFNGIDIDCNLGNIHFIYTYSQGMRADLNENCLNENNGVCDGSNIDWDADGNNSENCVSISINSDAAKQVLKDYSDWANIIIPYRGTGSGWRNN